MNTDIYAIQYNYLSPDPATPGFHLNHQLHSFTLLLQCSYFILNLCLNFSHHELNYLYHSGYMPISIIRLRRCFTTIEVEA